MAGDTILPGVQCYYVSNTPTDTNSSFNSVLNSLASAITGIPTGGAEGIAGHICEIRDTPQRSLICKGMKSRVLRNGRQKKNDCNGRYG